MVMFVYTDKFIDFNISRLATSYKVLAGLFLLSYFAYLTQKFPKKLWKRTVLSNLLAFNIEIVKLAV